MVELQANSRGVLVPVRASAGARRSGILGERNGALRVAVTAAAEKGKANAAIVGVLSEAFGIPKSRFELVAGETSQQKRFLIVGADVETVRTTIECLVGGSRS
jgi:uncharacterized protein (TIGR00251 family)